MNLRCQSRTEGTIPRSGKENSNIMSSGPQLRLKKSVLCIIFEREIVFNESEFQEIMLRVPLGTRSFQQKGSPTQKVSLSPTVRALYSLLNRTTIFLIKLN